MTQLHVGIVANEFFDLRVGRMGGFGWAAMKATLTLLGQPWVSRVTLFPGEEITLPPDGRIHGARVVMLPERPLRRKLTAWRNRPDILLCVDFRPSYLPVLDAFPGVPVVVWVRDPRDAQDWQRLESLRVPGREAEGSLGGTRRIDCFQLAEWSRNNRRQVILANKMRYLSAKIAGTYGLEPSEHILCNPDVVDYAAAVPNKSPRPQVVFLGRLDPQKRPWLAIELARRFPEAQFVMAGKNHFSHHWQPTDVPPNVQFAGHLEGAEKYSVLASAWVLVNTSIHEESPVSMFEAFSFHTPALSTVDSDDIAARHGIYVGRHNGTGLRALPALEAGLRDLLTHHAWRQELGQRARRFVETTHNNTNFASNFADLCRHAGLAAPQLPPAVEAPRLPRPDLPSEAALA